MAKQKCKCGHAEKYHLTEMGKTMCCVQWQSSETGFIRGCECSDYRLREVER